MLSGDIPHFFDLFVLILQDIYTNKMLEFSSNFAARLSAPTGVLCRSDYALPQADAGQSCALKKTYVESVIKVFNDQPSG